MNKKIQNLADDISNKLLPKVWNPGQYIGLEINARNKNVHDAEVTVALGFHDAYTIGISHLGTQILYQLLNDIDRVACDRTYCPKDDAEKIMREQNVGLFGWESRCAVKDFDILGFSLSYEVCCTNFLTMLDLAGIPLRAENRDESHPIIVAGDAMADSPEPIAPFVDIFVVGDGEVPLKKLVELTKQAKKQGFSRDEIILQAAQTIPSLYVPRFYNPVFNPDGTMAELARTRDDVPAEIQHSYISSFDETVDLTSPLVPLNEAVHDRVAIEVMRGCPNSCRFCQAGEIKLPVRHRKVEEVLEIARKALKNTGYREISLLSLSTSDYLWLDELIDKLLEEFTPQNVSISLPSLRVDSQLKQIPKLTSQVRKGGLTIAAEAATEKMRRAIRKNITDDDMIAGVEAAFREGFKSVKVYFMAGFPNETDEDLEGIVKLCKRLSWTRKKIDGHKGAISASVSWLVPKPHTPMQWCPMPDEDYFFSVREKLIPLARKSPVNLKFHFIERSLLETALCRGDRRVADVIETAWKNGARMDAWNEHFDWERWSEAFKANDLDPAFYRRQIPLDEVLPWSHIHCKRGHQWLKDEYKKMMEIIDS